MTATGPSEGAEDRQPGGGSRQKRRRVRRLAVPLLMLGLAGAALWFAGVPMSLQGILNKYRAEAEAAPRRPAFFDLPEMVANLNVTGRRPSYVKLRSKLELERPEDAVLVQAAMPRVLDLFATYLREMRPEELRGSIGTHRLREELLARVNLAVAPARVTDVLFIEILVQ